MIEKTITQCNIVWEIIYRDEFHKEKWETAGTSTLIHQINKNQVIWILPTLWFLSSTLFEKESSDLQAYLALLKYFEWIDDLIYSSYTADKVMELSKKFNRLIKHTEIPQQHQNFIMKFSNLLAVFMIQRTSQTNWFDQDLLDLSLHEVCDIRCSIDFKYAEYFQDFQVIIWAQVKQDFHNWIQAWKAVSLKSITSVLCVNNLVEASYKTRICAIFSYLIKLLKKEVVDLIWNQIIKNKWHINSEKSSYVIHVDDIIRFRQKIRVIERILNLQNVDVHDDSEKLIVFLISSMIIFILWLICHSELFCLISFLSVMYH